MAAIGGATGSAVSARRRASSPPPGPSPLIGLKPHEAGFVGRGQHEVASRRRLEDLSVEGEGAVHVERDAIAGTAQIPGRVRTTLAAEEHAPPIAARTREGEEMS